MPLSCELMWKINEIILVKTFQKMTKLIFKVINSKSIPYTKPQFNCADLNWAVSSLSGLAENKLI